MGGRGRRLVEVVAGLLLAREDGDPVAGVSSTRTILGLDNVGWNGPKEANDLPLGHSNRRTMSFLIQLFVFWRGSGMTCAEQP